MADVFQFFFISRTIVTAILSIGLWLVTGQSFVVFSHVRMRHVVSLSGHRTIDLS